jgi:hypothetical protein
MALAPAPSQMSQTSSLSDLLTAAKNIVIALNASTQSSQVINGTSSASGITTATVVKGSAGRLIRIAVGVAGSAPGAVYDASSITGITLGTTTKGLIAAIPNAVGSVTINSAVNTGIAIFPGSGQVLSVVYS